MNRDESQMSNKVKSRNTRRKENKIRNQQYNINPHEIISENINFSNFRKLNNHELINDVFSRLFVEKTNINTINILTKQFLNNIDPVKVFDFNFTSFSEAPIVFEYDNKIWTGYITKQESPYSNIPTKFINIKLPNHSYIYTNKYKHGIDNLKINSETVNFIKTLAKYIDIIPNFDYNLRINYKDMDGRLELYFEDFNNHKTVTVKYEYGTYNYFVNKESYSKAELKKILGK